MIHPARPTANTISIHALLAESDPRDRRQACLRYQFLSTLSLRRATNEYPQTHQLCAISIHALLAESDAGRQLPATEPPNFYPRSPCGERRASNQPAQPTQRISIHALLAESDADTKKHLTLQTISIHALLAESDTLNLWDAHRVKVFLSTLSLRRATILRKRDTPSHYHFYPRSPCGERRS